MFTGVRLLPQSFRRALTASVDSYAKTDKEYPFSGVTKSGRVWRKVPPGKRCSKCGSRRSSLVSSGHQTCVGQCGTTTHSSPQFSKLCQI